MIKQWLMRLARNRLMPLYSGPWRKYLMVQKDYVMLCNLHVASVVDEGRKEGLPDCCIDFFIKCWLADARATQYGGSYQQEEGHVFCPNCTQHPEWAKAAIARRRKSSETTKKEIV